MVYPRCIHHLRQLKVKHVLIMDFNKYPWREGSLHWASSKSGQKQIALQVRSSMELWKGSNNDSSLELELCKSFSCAVTSDGCQVQWECRLPSHMVIVDLESRGWE